MSALVLLAPHYLYKHIRNRVWSIGSCRFTSAILGHVRTLRGHRLDEASKLRETQRYTATPHCSRGLRLASSCATYQLHSRLADDCNASVQSTCFVSFFNHPAAHTISSSYTTLSFLQKTPAPRIHHHIQYHIHHHFIHHGNISRVALVALLCTHTRPHHSSQHAPDSSQ